MNDRIATECTSCGKVFAVGVAFAGKKIRCPQCKGVIEVAGGEPAPPRKASPPRTTGSSHMGSATSSGRPSEPRVARPIRRDEEDAPAPRRRESSQHSPRVPGRERPAKKKPVANYDDEPWGDLNSEDDGYDPFSPPTGMPPRARPAKTSRAQTEPVSSAGGRTDGGVITGILMMVGAVVWFFGGLAINRVFFYPPILFVVGLITTIKGALNAGK